MFNSTCIDNCTQCHQICLRMATTHCLVIGGKHLESEHFKLMLDCARICALSADLQLSESSFATVLCGLCAEICEACAESCEAIGDMDDCVVACRKCAKSCAEMAA